MAKLLGFPVTSRFGSIDKVHNAPHTGVDFGTPLNTPLESVTSGVVKEVQTDDLIGKHVTIKVDSNTDIVYGHLSEAKVQIGQSINRGDIIALTGNTGKSTGSHVHISVWHDGHLVDPTPWITGHPSLLLTILNMDLITNISLIGALLALMVGAFTGNGKKTLIRLAISVLIVLVFSTWL